MEDKILVNLSEDHVYECTTDIIGREGEGSTTRLEITIPEKLNGCSVYLDFEKPNGEKLRTPKLSIENGKAVYDVVQYLLTDDGEIKAQAVLITGDGKIWKSSKKRYIIQNSINALEEIPNKEDFMTEAQRLLDEFGNFITDTTLSKEGKSADAKAVGDALDKKSDVDYIVLKGNETCREVRQAFNDYCSKGKRLYFEVSIIDEHNEKSVLVGYREAWNCLFFFSSTYKLIIAVDYSGADDATVVVTEETVGSNTGGEQGNNGVGVEKIEKTSTSGLVDTYTITLTDGRTTTFTVTNGKNGTNGVGVSNSVYAGNETVDGRVIDIFDVYGTNGSVLFTLRVPNGKDGYTPVKGTDYFTAEDKEEIVNSVISALPVYSGEVADV